MKNEIIVNINDLLGNRESVIQQIIDALSEQINIEREIKEIISIKTDQIIKGQLETMLSSICKDSIDVPYDEVDRWGEKKGTKTIRKTIIEAIQKQCVYENKSYSSDRNIFTNIVNECVEKELVKFKNSFNKIIDEIFIDECQKYAISKLKERLKIN